MRNIHFNLLMVNLYVMTSLVVEDNLARLLCLTLSVLWLIVSIVLKVSE